MTLRRLLFGFCLLNIAAAAAAAGEVVEESARAIPVAYQVDVVVVGASTGGVAAAVRAAETGARVFLAAEHPYLGDDMTATLRLWPEAGDELDTPLARKLFDDPQGSPVADPRRLVFEYPGVRIHRRSQGRPASRHEAALAAYQRRVGQPGVAERAV
jgi:flavin-dependent dehydrogenase